MATHRVTIGDVARLAGVSKGTVSLAYSGKRPVADETRLRIIDAAAELDWTPSHRARALATSRTGTVGLVVARHPDVLATDGFFAQFIAGCESVLGAHEMGLMLHTVSDPEAEIAVYRRLAAGRADGVILLDVQDEDPRFTLVQKLGLPAVVLSAHRPAEGETRGLPVVYTDDSRPILELVDHLVDAGHTRIAHVSGPRKYIHARVRREAFLDAMARRGLEPVDVLEGDFTAASGRDATARLLDADRSPTAIVYANDMMAFAGLSLARNRGLHIPDDLSLTGFDDNELSAHLSPGLTTVATGAVERGIVAASTLLEVLAGGDPEDILVEHTDVVLRGSVAAPRTTLVTDAGTDPTGAATPVPGAA